jgi:hypothetical protein
MLGIRLGVISQLASTGVTLSGRFFYFFILFFGRSQWWGLVW